ncbi:unnamed protein product [Urochloa humidicola]
MSGVVAVTKASPVVVRPSSERELETPPPHDTVALSPFDKLVAPIPVTSLLVFDRPINNPAKTIERALSRALASYRPVAGRLGGAGGIIACTDDGVTFVAASASCPLHEATSAAALQDMDLSVLYPGLLCRDAADPLLMVQVTEFACGGFVVAVTSNHVVADGVGTAQFLHAVADLPRGVASPPRFPPVRAWDGGASCRLGLPAPALAVPAAAAEHEPPPRLARLDVVIPSGLISRVKAGEFGGEPCTALDAVMAVLWRCRTRAALYVDAAAESPAPLKFVCDMRELAGAPAGYYGNCVRAQVVMATASAVAGGSLGDLVRLIRRAKEKIPDLLISGKVAAGQAPAAPVWYEAFSVTDWRYLGLDSVHFGRGAPARVLWHVKRVFAPWCVVCPPRRGGRDGAGVDVTSMFVKPEHADAFLGELACKPDRVGRVNTSIL